MGAQNSQDDNPTVSSGYLRSIFQSALSFGVARDVLEKIIGGPETLLEISTRRFSYDVLLSIFETSAEALGDPAIGLRFGRNVRAERRIDTIYATTFCADLEHAIRLNIDYQPLIHTMGRTQLTYKGDSVIVGFNPVIPASEGYRIFMDAMFTSYVSIGQWLAWSMQSPVSEMRFVQAPPDKLSAYEDVFRCPLLFSASRNEMEVPRSAIKSGIPSHNAEIMSELFPVLDQKLMLLSRPFSLAEEVKTVIEGNLRSGHVDIGTVCRQLNLGERTLRRRLNKDGVNFRELLKTVREEQAGIFMHDKNMTLAQIAHELGFHDQSAFSRAFKIWKQESPNSYRQRILGRASS